MCLMRREAVFPVQDLRRVSITCPQCETEVILDMTKFERKFGGRNFAPSQCPACKTPYDSAVAALEDVQKAFEVLSKAGGVVNFHAGVED